MFFVLAFIVLLCVVTKRKALLTPQFGFALCFIPSILFSFLWVNKWGLDLHIATIAVLTGGVALFFLTSLFMYVTFNAVAPSKGEEIPAFRSIRMILFPQDQKIKISSIRLAFFAVIQLATLLLLMRFIMHYAHTSSLSAAMYQYRVDTAIENKASTMPGYLMNLRYLSIASGYIWGYIFCYNFPFKRDDRKNVLLLLFNLLLSIGNSLITGSRTSAILTLAAMFIQMYFITGKRRAWKKIFSPKIMFKLAILGLGVVGLFVVSIYVMGRSDSSEVDLMSYFSIYLSAEIKNLDVFIRKGNFGTDWSDKQTLIYAINYIAPRIGKPELVHELVVPFRQIHGMSLGNVSTIFYAYLYDDGYKGLVIYTILMALITQIMFFAAERSKCRNKISFSVVLYSYVYTTILLSFFSCKFYESVFNIVFIKMILFWIFIIIMMQLKVRR